MSVIFVNDFMGFKTKRAKASAENGKKEKVIFSPKPPAKPTRLNSSIVDEANILDDSRRKSTPNKSSSFLYDYDQQWNGIFSSQNINQLAQLIPCKNCEMVGHCRAIPTSWAGWIMYYEVVCVQTYGGCGYRNYVFKSNEEDFSLRAGVAMKVTGIRIRQMQRYYIFLTDGKITPEITPGITPGITPDNNTRNSGVIFRCYFLHVWV